MRNMAPQLSKYSIILMLVLLFSACRKERINIDTTPPPPVTDLVALAQDGSVILSCAEPISDDLATIEITYSPGSSIV